MHFLVVVAVGDVGKHRAPDDDRQAELVIDVDRGDGHRRAVMGGGGDDVLVGAQFRRRQDADVGLAFVVEHDELVFVLGLGVGVAQAHRQVGGIAAADAVRRRAPAQRSDEADLDLRLGVDRGGRQAQRQRRREDGHVAEPYCCHDDTPPMVRPRAGCLGADAFSPLFLGPAAFPRRRQMLGSPRGLCKGVPGVSIPPATMDGAAAGRGRFRPRCVRRGTSGISGLCLLRCTDKEGVAAEPPDCPGITLSRAKFRGPGHGPGIRHFPRGD